jgi:thioredoxin reductase/NAD-dependent dihydropyrimidine dehydrogenase PreA subunit
LKTKWIVDLILGNLTWFLVVLLLIPIYFAKKKRDTHLKKSKTKLKKAIATQMHEPITLHPEIDPNICAGCGACTRACPEGDILGLINHKAILVSPTKCVGHGECEQACPVDAIKLVFGTKTRGMDIPRLTGHYETNVAGLYIAGELGGMGLIRNATKQGALAARHALANSTNKVSDQLDLLIIGAGPAGLAAALVAAEKKSRYLLIEQNTFGGTIANFPRQKLVMSHPFQLAIFGEITFPSQRVVKEDLLRIWNSIRKKVNLQLKEQVRFETLEKTGNHFVVKTNQGIYKANKVILAMGVRGTPRRLGIPNEDLSKVTYNLIDAAQYKAMNLVVVGGGNAGVEAAQMLAAAPLQNKVTLLVRSQTFDRCNEDNIKKICELENQRRVTIWFNSSVKEIRPTELVIDHEGATTQIPNDYLFIFAGAEMPHKFLMSLGISIDKKFGAA